MNIFVLSAGRAASTTFARACVYIDNYSCAHESNAQMLFPQRMTYPNNHIEVDNRLVWFLPLIESYSKGETYFVYLKKDLDKIAHSYELRWGLRESIVKAFGHGILMRPKISHLERIDICRSYTQFCEESILSFISDKRSITIEVDNIKEGFDQFFDDIGACGDKEAALEELSIKYNVNSQSFKSKFKRFLSNNFLF
ncbi:hypothetical protein J5X92_10635 [Alteromonas sp. K632G]|jgi:hypothetical protein|uniref:hypothetical protein n=1 Tax=Alteromonas sp. K632G TaxID=2820757 RepID=UPI000C0F68FA|nr:hypothetical protein [Alteromonas sp. K632G]MBO7922675.1 hypothetical protein [Alteromonas sp. K632G]PHS59376.1 MAG: hypothetical protein COB03_02825 [Alteromonas sp.]